MARLFQLIFCGMLLGLFLPAFARAQMEQEFSFELDVNAGPVLCSFPGLNLPPNVKIYAAGASNDRSHLSKSGIAKLSWRIDDNSFNYEATLIKVLVNSPKEPVVLMLGTTYPNVWHISWTKGTTIAAVFVSGAHTQKIVGLPPNVPVLNSTRTNQGACGYLNYIDVNNEAIKNDVDLFSTHLFGRKTDGLFGVKDGRAMIGEDVPPNAFVETKAELRKEDFYDPAKPPAGPAGLIEAARHGFLKKAGKEEIQKYLEIKAKKAGLPDNMIAQGLSPGNSDMPDNAYVVLSPDFTFPDDISGGQPVTFLLPKGMPWPYKPAANYVVGSLDDAGGPAEARSQIPKTCGFADFKLPPNLKVYAAGAFSGSKLDLQIDDSGQPAGFMEITVNSPREPAALLLGAASPTLWRLSLMEGSKVAAVVISGYPGQTLIGLPEGTPILNISDQKEGLCPAFNVSSALNNLLTINDLSRHLFKKDVDQLYYTYNGKALIGDFLSDFYRSKRDEGRVPSRRRGDALDQGWFSGHFPNGEGKKDSGRNGSEDKEECLIPGLKLSPNSRIYAAGGHGLKSGWTIDGGNAHEALITKVAVNSPKEPVVLVLAAYEPTIWHVGWTRGTVIEAVLVSGYEPQRITGLPKNVPVLNSFARGSDNPCGSFYFSDEESILKTAAEKSGDSVAYESERKDKNIRKANEVSKQLFGREIDHRFAVVMGQTIIGEALTKDAELVSHAELREEDFRRPHRPLRGEAGLAEALHKGLIKEATPADIRRHYEIAAIAADLPENFVAKGAIPDARQPAYMVLSPAFVVPDGLSGSHTFYLPEGIPNPSGRNTGANFINFSDILLEAERSQKLPGVCRFPDLDLPPNLGIYAVGAESASKLNHQIDASGKPATMMQLVVNLLDGPAALLLWSPDPTIWHFSWSKGSKIQAVYLSGNYEQRIIGLPEDVPVIQTSGNFQDQCPKVPISRSLRDLIRINGLSKHLFKRGVNRVYVPKTGYRVIGEPADLNYVPKPETMEKFDHDKIIPPHIYYGPTTVFAEAARNGLIREATRDDWRQRLLLIALKAGLPDKIAGDIGIYGTFGKQRLGKAIDDPSPITDSYMLLSPDFRIPVRLFGRESAIFISADGSMVKCSLAKPGKPPDFSNNSYPKLMTSKAESKKSISGYIDHADAGETRRLSPDLKPIGAGEYEVLSSNFRVPPELYKQNTSKFHLADGAIMSCGFHRLDETVDWYKYGGVKFLGHYEPGTESTTRYQISSACGLAGFQAPPKLKVYAVGASHGSKLNIQLDDSGPAATLTRLTINSPQEPVALILASEKPLIWHLNWTEGTKIAAVFASGSNKGEQRISGLPEGVPVYLDTPSEFSPCPSLSIRLTSDDRGGGDAATIRDALMVNTLANHLFKTDIDQIYDLGSDQAVIGAPLADNVKLQTAAEFDVKKFTPPGKPLAGLDGLRQAEEKGLIRKATANDYRKWLDQFAKMNPQDENGLLKFHTDKPPPLDRCYVILSPDFVMPAGLNQQDFLSQNRESFIVPEDIPIPRGPKMNSIFFFMKDGQCHAPSRAGCRPRLK